MINLDSPTTERLSMAPWSTGNVGRVSILPATLVVIPPEAEVMLRYDNTIFISITQKKKKMKKKMKKKKTEGGKKVSY